MTEVIDVQYTAIIKDGGLFIPNVFSDLNDGGSHIVQVEVDIEEVRQQLGEGAVSTLETPKKDTAKASKKPAKRITKKDAQKEIQQLSDDEGLSALRKSAIDELEALDDVELSEIFKAYMNDGQTSEQISLENL
jgi:MinD-like ATPase involved in chromosome partitioning or flagellar assembly